MGQIAYSPDIEWEDDSKYTRSVLSEIDTSRTYYFNAHFMNEPFPRALYFLHLMYVNLPERDTNVLFITKACLVEEPTIQIGLARPEEAHLYPKKIDGFRILFT